MLGRLRTFVVLLVLGGSCSYGGCTKIMDAWSYSAPAPISCEEFAKNPKLEGWVSLEKCQALPLFGAYSSMKRRGSSGDGIITDVALPVRPLGAEGKATLLLVSSEDARIAKATQARDAISKIEGSGAEAITALMKNAELLGGYELAFQAKILGQRGSAHTDLTRGLTEGVSNDAILLEEAAPGTPPVLWPVLQLLLGLVLVLAALGSLLPDQPKSDAPAEAGAES